MDGRSAVATTANSNVAVAAAVAVTTPIAATATEPHKPMTAVYYYANTHMIWLSRYECVVARLVRGIVCILFHLLANGNSI